ncbi:hypothetical protein B0T19DRAFT_11338 [Cercophora scortea]|uniref:Secreted protein n=1 Tax=Cercophora scortea TaxID=314031 RepID=A0AAE0MK85_9PEZI|nr:hypothetical protein B0T19DRAFT_11338 [Cercophora scortea]
MKCNACVFSSSLLFCFFLIPCCLCTVGRNVPSVRGYGRWYPERFQLFLCTVPFLYHNTSRPHHTTSAPHCTSLIRHRLGHAPRLTD